MNDNKVKFYWFLGHEQFQPEVLVKHALAVEKAGFDGVMVSDHLNPWVSDAGASGFVWSTLGAIASTTKKLSIMTAVTAPLFRLHPALAAQASATVDRLSNGRFELGLGSGENINEAPLGYNLPAYGERVKRMVEAVQIIERLLAGEKLNFKGDYYTVDKLKLYSPPSEHVPIYLAAGGPQSARLAGKYFDGVITSVKKIETTLNEVAEPAQSNARHDNFRLIATRWTVHGKTADEAWQALQPWRGLRAPNRLYETDPEQLQKSADRLPREEVLAQYEVVATADDYIKAYRPLVEDLKANVVGIQTTSVNQLETIELVGKSVLPQLRKIN